MKAFTVAKVFELDSDSGFSFTHLDPQTLSCTTQRRPTQI